MRSECYKRELVKEIKTAYYRITRQTRQSKLIRMHSAS
jgi:hypothetical protein